MKKQFLCILAGMSLCAYGLETQEVRWKKAMEHHYDIYNDPTQDIELRIYSAFELTNGFTFQGNDEELAEHFHDQAVALARASGRLEELQGRGVV